MTEIHEINDKIENPWGYHLLLNCRLADWFKITDYNTVYNFAKELVEEIDMVAYGEPQIVNFGTGDKAGFTLVQLIETSNITGHFTNETSDIYLDVFSCKPFDEKDVLRVVDKYFSPKSIDYLMVERKA